MSTLISYTGKCGTFLPKGTQHTVYVGLIPELGGTWPDTKLAVELAAEPTYEAEAGDTKILYEAFDFTNAAAGLGYFRTFPILLNSGDLRDLLEGDIGGQGHRQELPFFLEGVNPESNEAADCFLAWSGCMFCLITDKAGQTHVLGSPDNPVFVQQSNSALQERVGWDFVFTAENGLSHMFYDAEQFGIELTPNS
jgi:hypothetical protein